MIIIAWLILCWETKVQDNWKVAISSFNANNGTHCGQWECSHSLPKGLHTALHANLLLRLVWTGPWPRFSVYTNPTMWPLGVSFCSQNDKSTLNQTCFLLLTSFVLRTKLRTHSCVNAEFLSCREKTNLPGLSSSWFPAPPGPPAPTWFTRLPSTPFVVRHNVSPRTTNKAVNFILFWK